MADNPYQNGKLNIGPAAEVAAIHPKAKASEKPVKITGSDLRDGKKGK